MTLLLSPTPRSPSPHLCRFPPPFPTPRSPNPHLCCSPPPLPPQEHSFFADLRSVVVQALQGKTSDVTEDTDQAVAVIRNTLSTTGSASYSGSLKGGPQVGSGSPVVPRGSTIFEEEEEAEEEEEMPVGRQATVMEGVYRGLQSVISTKPKLLPSYSISRVRGGIGGEGGCVPRTAAGH